MKRALSKLLSIFLSLIISMIPFVSFFVFSFADIYDAAQLPATIPSYPPEGQRYWVIFNEGCRNNRLEMSTFDVSDDASNVRIIWNTNLKAATDSGSISRSEQFHYTETEWIHDRTYSILSDKATFVFASNVNIYDKSGNLLLAASEGNGLFGTSSLISGYCGGEGDGKNLTWNLDSDGTLTISGTGRMKDYATGWSYSHDYWTNAPWGGPTESCERIKTLVIQPGVTSIGIAAFENCSELISVSIPTGVTSIGAYVFRFCAGLTSVTIPYSITSIGDYAFNYCDALSDVWYTGTEAQWKKIAIGSGNDPLKSTIIHYNSPAPVQNTQVFSEKKYIADIWLDRHPSIRNTTEAMQLAYIFDYESLSSSVFESLKSDAGYQNSLKLWNGMKIVFDPTGAADEVLIKKSDIYEALVLDLIEKQMTENGEQIENIMLDAVDLTGTGAKYVTKTKKMVDQLLSLVKDPTKDFLTYLKENRGEVLGSIGIGFADLDETADGWSDNKFVEGIGLIADVAENVSDFFERFSLYAMAVEMSEEMHTLLLEMSKQTNNGYLKAALIKVANAMGNTGYASIICTLKLSEDLTMTFIKECFEDVCKACPQYLILRGVYKAATAFDDLMFNTSGSIDAYYLTEATTEFVRANKAAITSLAKKYKTSGTEKDAGAYVFAAESYIHVIEIDLDSALHFVKAASEEGLVNLSWRVIRSISNWVYGENETSVYDQMLEDKEEILSNISQQFFWLHNSWKLNELYLKTDYPDVYSIYAQDEYAKEIYSPRFLSVSLDENGKTEIKWRFNDSVYNKEKKVWYGLYGVSALNGVEIVEKAGTGETVKRVDNIYVGSATVFNRNTFSVFPKTYSIAGYSETARGYVYTPISEKQLMDPCEKTQLYLLRTASSVALGIYDSSPVKYANKVYHIFRSTTGGEFSKIAEIPAQYILGGRVTSFVDQDVVDGKEYQYYVVSQLSFNGGLQLRSPVSKSVSIKWKTKSTSPQTLTVTDNRTSQGQHPARAPQKAPSLAEQKGTRRGIVLSWSPAAGATGYEIYRKVSYGAYFRPLGIVTGTTYTDTAVEDAAGYEYMVVPVAQSGDATRYDLQTTAEGEVEPVTPDATPGDVDEDGKVTASDARLALRCAVGLEEYASGSAQFLACDVDRDDRVTASDARLILRAAVGLETLS